MSDDRVDVPRSLAERMRSDTRLLTAVVVAAVALVAIAVLLAFVWMGGADRDGRPDARGADGPARASDEPTRTDGAADDAPEPSDGGTPATSANDGAPAPIRAPLIAFRSGGIVRVAAEDGRHAVDAIAVEDGAFSLSPDGLTLAWIDVAAGALHLATVEDGTDIVVGPAEDLDPAWSPDSSHVVYTASTGSGLGIRRVGRDGRGDASVGVGHSPAVSPDGATVACITSATPGVPGPIALHEIGGRSTILERILATEVAYGVDGLVYCEHDGAVATQRIMTSRPDGSAARALVADIPDPGRPVMCGALRVSHDGEGVMFAAFGDDGFSRAYVVVPGRDAPTSLTSRRDTYPIGWSADGTRVYFVEGNAFQGEPTNLLSAFADGFGRVVVVEDAGL